MAQTTQTADDIQHEIARAGRILGDSQGQNMGEQNPQDIVIRGIVHDINNNLMAILSACDRLEGSSAIGADVPWAVAMIRTHLHNITAQLKDLVHTGQMDTVMMSAQELQQFLDSIMPSLNLVAGRAARIELGSVVTGPVHVHKKPLLRVLLQLVRNVAETGVDYPLALVSARQVDRWCEISVADNGPGILGVSPSAIFNAGVTTKDSTGDSTGDDAVRGYGLASVARAVRDWGGDCGVEPIAKDTGCRFWVRLPLVNLDA